MAAKAKAYVLDSWAIIAYYEDEPAGERVADLISLANEQNLPLWMSVVNAGEVWYIIARKTSAADADNALQELQSLGIWLESPDWKTSRQAAIFKSKHRLSLADAFTAALAVQKNAHLITGD